MIKYLFVFAFGYLAGSVNCHAQTNVQGAMTYLNQYGQPVTTVMPLGSSQVVLNQYGQVIGFGIPVPPAPASLPLPAALPTLPMMPILGAIK
jgi:hypothetical protein